MTESISSRLKKDTAMTQASFDRLLACLGTDRESAGRAYLDLRRALFTYFSVKGAADPDLLIDETFDRVARRLDEGQTIFTESPAHYFYGVARNVWRESLPKVNAVAQLSNEMLPPLASLTTPHELMVEAFEQKVSDKRLACLEQCLERFSAADRELIVGYYRASGGEKIENRKAMAARLALSLDSLRHKTARLRLKLSSCIRQCQKARPHAS